MLQVSFLPWVKFDNIIQLGPITFWPYYEEVSKRITDMAVKGHLDKYFKTHVDHRGSPVDTITICSYTGAEFNSLNDTEYGQLRSAVDILVFASIAPQVDRAVCSNNPSWGPPSADIFELVTQNYEPGDDYFAVKAGSLLSGGLKIGDITFPQPWAKGGARASLDSGLLQGFNAYFSFTYSADKAERLFRSLEWFRLAHIEGGDISYFSKLVMMATALESLLQFPPIGKRKYFVDYVEDNIATNKFLRDTKTDHKGKSFTYSLAGCWAWDFYELRSAIVHGSHVSAKQLLYKSWITHLIVADLVFLEVLNLSFTIKATSTRLLGFDDVHKALGWIQ